MSRYAFYGLSCNPFDKQAFRDAGSFDSRDHHQMISRLNYLKDVRGVGVFTATPGMGKSYTLRCFEHSLNKNLYHMTYLCLSTISVSEFYKQLCDRLGLDPKGGKTMMFRSIQERLYYLFKDKRQPLILAIDEAQYLNNGILKDLKMLMNFNYDSVNCFSLILCGEPFLNRTLEKPPHESLRQRITVHYAFQGLKPDEVSAYIFHKLALAGGSESIMGEDALNAISGYCQGNPRIIDNLMTDVLTLGSQLKRQVIDSEVVLSAANEQTLG